jgi:hypothetical protein
MAHRLLRHCGVMFVCLVIIACMHSVSGFALARVEQAEMML